MKPFPENTIPNSVELMEIFLRAASLGGKSSRETYLAREALQGILRLARSEQLLDIRRSVDKLVPLSIQPQPARRAKSKRNSRTPPGQKQFVFGREN